MHAVNPNLHAVNPNLHAVDSNTHAVDSNTHEVDSKVHLSQGKRQFLPTKRNAPREGEAAVSPFRQDTFVYGIRVCRARTA